LEKAVDAGALFKPETGRSAWSPAAASKAEELPPARVHAHASNDHKPLKQVRRVLAEQLTDTEDDIFCCPICTHVLWNPVIATCSHLFCSSCFDEWKELCDGPPTPCPVCQLELTPDQVEPLQSEEGPATSSGSTRMVLTFVKQLRVRCLFHPEVRVASSQLLGPDVERAAASEMTCTWCGPMQDYDWHMDHECVVNRVVSLAQK
jgi:hypothetical protein